MEKVKNNKKLIRSGTSGFELDLLSKQYEMFSLP